jgi:hypothetical protein
MKYFAEYGDNALPGEVYSAKFGEDILFDPQSKVDYMMGKKFKFKPKETGDLFQRFLALQLNPEALFTDTARMPNTPFGNLGQYMGS